MTLHIYTQCRENYGDPTTPYWKMKGGRTVVLTGIADADFAPLLEWATPRIEAYNPMFEEYICGYGIQPDDALTDDERDQLEYDGRITYPSTRLAYQPTTT